MESDPVQVHVLLFGRFRDWVPEGRILLGVRHGAPLGEVRDRIARALQDLGGGSESDSTLAMSAFSDGSRILEEDWVVSGGDPIQLAVLPPVCGG